MGLDSDKAATRKVAPDHDFRVLIERGEEVHQSRDGKALQPVV